MDSTTSLISSEKVVIVPEKTPSTSPNKNAIVGILAMGTGMLVPTILTIVKTHHVTVVPEGEIILLALAWFVGTAVASGGGYLTWSSAYEARNL